MMRRVVAAVVLVLALSAAPALGQSNPFEPIPAPVIPTATPTLPPVQPSTPTDNGNTVDEGTDRTLLYGIGGGLVLLVAGIGIYIARDARRNLTDADRRSLDREKAGAPREDLTPEQRKEANRQKQKARAKGKAQRQARKAQRKR